MIIIGVKNWESHLGKEGEAGFVLFYLLLGDYIHLPFLRSLEEHGNIIVGTLRTYLRIMKKESIHS